MPRALAQGDHPGHDALSHLRLDEQTPEGRGYLHFLTVLDGAGNRIHRIDPQLMASPLLDGVQRTVGGMGTAAMMVADQLQGESLPVGSAGLEGKRRVHRQRTDHLVIAQHEMGRIRQNLLGVHLDLARGGVQGMAFGVVPELLEGHVRPIGIVTAVHSYL